MLFSSYGIVHSVCSQSVHFATKKLSILKDTQSVSYIQEMQLIFSSRIETDQFVKPRGFFWELLGENFAENLQ